MHAVIAAHHLSKRKSPQTSLGNGTKTKQGIPASLLAVSYTHLTLPTTTRV